jgi:DNA-binding CsgD family transcriptional regulator
MAGVAEATELAREIIPVAEQRLTASGMPATVGARREADLHLATARGHMARLRRRADPDAWRHVADGWRDIPVPYGAAKSHWWEAEASLAAGVSRDRGREALIAGWEIARTLPARPLMRELAELARRARITLPGVEEASLEPVLASIAVGPGRVSERLADDSTGAERVDTRRARRAHGAHDQNGVNRPGFDDVPAGTSLAEVVSAITARLVGDGAAPSEPFGLSPRESEVLSILAEGKTNREIAERLFISDRTVAVHVRNILMKLGVAGRVEAASVAIRLGLVAGFSRGQYR